MTAGKKPSIASVKKNLTIDEQVTRNNRNESLKNDFTKLTNRPSRHLSDTAKAEFKRILPLLEQLPLAELDRRLIEQYCTMYSVYRALEEDINNRGEVITEYFANGNEKSTKINPALRELVSVAKEIRSIGSELGMSISSRARLIDPNTEENDPLAELFKDN